MPPPEPREICTAPQLLARKRPRSSKADDASLSSSPTVATEVSDETLLEANAYFPTRRLGLLPFRRLLPFSETLMDMSDVSRTVGVSPFLREYYNSIGKEPPPPPSRRTHTDAVPRDERDVEESHWDETQQQPLTADALEDPRFSKLTERQHSRYLQWVVCPPTARNDRNEFKKIAALLREERGLYWQALVAFWSSHRDDWSAMVHRSMDGMVAAVASRQSRTTQYTPTRYGHCRQVISLVPTGSAFASLTMDSIVQRELVATHEQVPPKKSTSLLHLETLPVMSEGISLSPRSKDSSRKKLRLLGEDSEALALAKRHSVDIIITDRALHALVPYFLDASESPSRHLPNASGTLLLGARRVTNHDKVVLVEDPLLYPLASPRQIFDCTYEEGLWDRLGLNDAGSSGNEVTPQSRYHLVEFPRLAKPPLRVLIRSQVECLYQGRPVHFMPRIEVFLKRGKSLVTERERALWLVDHCLLQTQPVVAIIDAQSSHIVTWEEPSVAFALTLTTHEAIYESLMAVDAQGMAPRSGSLDGFWKACAHCLSGLTTIGHGSYLVKIPGQLPTSKMLSASVHAADDSGELNVRELEESQAASVNGIMTSSEAPLQTFQLWDWPLKERIPYTFPVAKKS